jgi:phage-related protein
MSQIPTRKIPLVFFVTDAGSEPVRDWLLELPDDDRRTIGRDLATAQYGWPIGMPLCRPLGRGLFEIRSSLGERIARVFICHHDGTLVALHAIIKKTSKLPPDDVALARKRMKDLSG